MSMDLPQQEEVRALGTSTAEVNSQNVCEQSCLRSIAKPPYTTAKHNFVTH
jgi:hypothetical protein